MPEVADWDPVDDSNNQPSPAGFPEFMPVSGFNNSCRMMMGAIKRWQTQVTDPVTGYLPLSGGTISGTVSAVMYQVSGRNFASANGAANMIYDGSGEVAIACYGSTAQQTYFINDTHTWENNAGTLGMSLDNAGHLSVVGNVNAPAYQISGLNVLYADSATVSLFDRTGFQAQAITSTITYYQNTEHLFRDRSLNILFDINASLITARTPLTVTGNIAGGAQVTGNSISSASFVNAASYVNATEYRLRGVTFAEMDIAATRNVLYDPSGVANIIMYGAPGHSNYYIQTDHIFQSRGQSTTYVLFSAGGTFNQTGGWGTISDDRLKADVEPYTAGLDAVLALQPVSFRYSAGPFASEDRQIGLMASNVKAVLPEMVKESTFAGAEGEEAITADTLTPTQLIYTLIGAVKELTARVATLEKDHV